MEAIECPCMNRGPKDRPAEPQYSGARGSGMFGSQVLCPAAGGVKHSRRV